MKRLGPVLACCVLIGCGGADHGDLRAWMDENSKNLRGIIPKLPEAQPYRPVPYDVEGSVDPFRSSKIEPESKARIASAPQNPLQPDFAAREQRNSVLERYPLESLKVVGFLNANKVPMALIKVENKVRQVKNGEYLGLDFGKVIKISDKEVLVRELIQDSTGEWSERLSPLLLQGTEGSQK